MPAQDTLPRMVGPDLQAARERIVPGLRFVERPAMHHNGTLKILQQLIEITEYQGDWAYNRRYEWRDVPLVTEEDANAGG